MASVNRVIILGNLGQDPEVRYTPSGAAVCTLSVATTETRTDRDGNRQDNTEWHRVVVWNKQAENCAKYLSKGRSVYVEGRLQTRSWDDKNTGQKKYTTEIIAQTVQFIGGGRDQGAHSAGASAATGFGGGMAADIPSFQENSDSFGGPGTPSLDDIPF